MKKIDELNSQTSCLNKAKSDELVFVLRQKDTMFARTVRYWCLERIKNNINDFHDPKIQEALHCASEADGICIYTAFELDQYLHEIQRK